MPRKIIEIPRFKFHGYYDLYNCYFFYKICYFNNRNIDRK